MKNIEGVIFVAALAFLSCNAQFRQFRGRHLRADEPCGEPGFFRDTQDCTKFYRCAEHETQIQGVTYISKHEFNCPAGTIFDESVSTCNHYDLVPNRPAECQRPVLPQPSQEDPPQSVDDQQQQQPPAESTIKFINLQNNPLFYTNTIAVPGLRYLQGTRTHLINYI